ncbi:MAG: hypothetical protein AB7V18_12370, partial [Pyrinomonadaceae bacterium]
SQTARPTSARIETEAARRFAPNSPKGTFDVLAKPDIFICYQHFRKNLLISISLSIIFPTFTR